MRPLQGRDGSVIGSTCSTRMMEVMKRSAIVLALLAAMLALPATANASLQYGSHGPAVLALQRKLVRLK